MAGQDDSIQQGSTAVTSDIAYGLAQMEKHWKAADGLIENCGAELWDSWPVRDAMEAVREDVNLGEGVRKRALETDLAVLAGRMFLAGSESLNLGVLSRKAPSGTPAVSEPNATISNATIFPVVNEVACAIHDMLQDDDAIPACATEVIARQPDISTETRTILQCVAAALWLLKKQRRVDQLVSECLNEIPQEEMDNEVEDILRLSEEEQDEDGGAA